MGTLAPLHAVALPLAPGRYCAGTARAPFFVVGACPFSPMQPGGGWGGLPGRMWRGAGVGGGLGGNPTRRRLKRGRTIVPTACECVDYAVANVDT